MSPWKGNCCSASQEIPHILRNLSVHYHVPRSLPLVLILCSKGSVQVWDFGKSFIPSFYGEEALAPHWTPKLEDHSLSALCYCLFSKPLYHDERDPLVMVTTKSTSWPPFYYVSYSFMKILLHVSVIEEEWTHMVLCGNADTTYLLL